MPRKFRIIDTYNVLDLFCGCGGLSHGLQQAGLNIVAGIDHWDKAIDSYRKNYRHQGICADLTQFSPSDFETKFNKGRKIHVIVGGPPCQGFSMAGKRDKNDPRNSLFMEYVKYLNYYKPRIFLFENVMGILSMKTDTGEKCIDVILSLLRENYTCLLDSYYASDFEVPQNRRRVIIIGVRNDLMGKLGEIPPIPKPIKNSRDRIPVSTVLLEREKVPESYFLSEKAITGIKNKKNRMVSKSYGFGAQYLNLDKPSYTIPARYWKDGYDALVKYDEDSIRRLTELELKRIQTFPDEYTLCGSKKDVIMQIGNAVPCRFAYHLGTFLVNLLEGL